MSYDDDDDFEGETTEHGQFKTAKSFLDGVMEECAHMNRAVGAPQQWDDPAAMLAAGLRCLKWLRENPLYEAKVFSAKNGLRFTSMPKKRAGTIQGLAIWLGTSVEGLREYEQKPGFSGIIGYLRHSLHQDKLEGAAADLLNPMVIMRDLGLQEQVKTEGDQRVEHSGKVAMTIDLEHDRERALAEAAKRGLPAAIFDK